MPSLVDKANLFRKPMGLLPLAANATMTMVRMKTLPSICCPADILVASIDRPQMVKSSWVKPGAALIAVGINRIVAPKKWEARHCLWATSRSTGRARSLQQLR